jgi:hypothetical protein
MTPTRIPLAVSGYLGWAPDTVPDGRDAREGLSGLVEPHVISA